MLQVRRGIAAKSYENTFFREFAQNLSIMFEKYNIDGLLIGNSECSVECRLQIDALLITKSVVCIIDFKNFGGNINLPHTSDFMFGRWTNSTNDIIKGGSSINPYCQLKTQRKRFYDAFMDYIEPNLAEGDFFNAGHTVRVVCFQKEIELNGSIPPQDEVNFKIIHKGNYLEKIKDIIDVHDDSVNLNKGSFQAFLSVFEADPFDLSESYEESFNLVTKEESSLNFEELRNDQKLFLSELDSFLKNEDEQVFILQGTSHSGKTHLVPFMQEIVFNSGISQIEILAPSNRVSNNLIQEIENINSLYSFIYGGASVANRDDEIEDDSSNETVENEKANFKIIPLKKSDNEDNAIYIVDESQLISDSYHRSIDLRFGSGHLLQDFIKFVDLTDSSRKIIFIGDCYQISPANSEENALSPKYLENKYELNVRAFQLNDYTNPNTILKNALRCVNGIRQNLYNNLDLQFDNNFLRIDKNEVSTLFKKNLENHDNFKFLCYTNEESQNVNLWIKRTILKNGEALANGDLLLLNSNIHVEEKDNPFSHPKKLFNGQFFRVIEIGPSNTEMVSLSGNRSVELSFVELVVKDVSNNSTVSILSFENYRLSAKGELSESEMIGLNILLNRELKNFKAQHPFEKSNNYEALQSSPEFKTLKSEIEQLKQELQSGEKVKTKLNSKESELNRLTKSERRKHTLILETQLMRDPNSKFYRYKNLALVRYGWAMNVHKSMSYKWDNIIFNVDWGGGISNESYYKWLYTGITRATNQIHLINYQNISPFSKIVLKDAHNEALTSKEYFAVFDPNQEFDNTSREILNKLQIGESPNGILIAKTYSLVTSKLQTSNLRIKSIEHPSYQEVYTITDGQNDAIARFYYDKKWRVKVPSMQGSNKDFENSVFELLTKGNRISNFSFIEDNWRVESYEKLKSYFGNNGLYIQNILQSRLKDYLIISSEDSRSLEFEMYYNGDGFFTSIIAKQYSDKVLWDDLAEFLEKLRDAE